MGYVNYDVITHCSTTQPNPVITMTTYLYMSHYVKNITLSIKPEVPVRSVLHYNRRKTEPRSQVTCAEDYAKFGHVVSEICTQTYRQTYINADRNTSHPSQG